jgi:DNA invertase Pin-like site-specific DNA recombinase
MKIAIYARVSTDKQETENQLLQLREFASKLDWQIFLEYVDYESGSKSDRAAFKQMFEDAAKRRFDLVLFWSLDRLSREGVLETLQHLNRLTSYGVAYKSFTEQYFDSCGVFKDAVIAIMATVAKQERVKRSERTKAGLARVRAEGRTLGRPRLEIQPAQIARLRSQGYRCEPSDGNWVFPRAQFDGCSPWLRNKRSLKDPAKCFQSGAGFYCADCVGKVRYLRT